MKKVSLNKRDRELISIGKEGAIRGFRDDEDITCNLAGALITKSGKTYSGINLHFHKSGGLSICGERSTITQMVSEGEKEIDTIVAVWISRKYKKNKEWGILPPCGTCRHEISYFGNPWVIISKTKKVRLKDLYPIPYP